MYVNGKVVSVETFQECGRSMKESSEGLDSSKIYLIYFKNFCKCHNVPTLSTTINK
jgi:hypothetical protein